MNEYRSQLRPFEVEYEVAPEVIVRRTGGHTPGHSVVRLASGGDRLMFAGDASAEAVGPMTARGYRYITIQVRDVDHEHAGIVARGGAEGRPPITLGTTARISFVRDPDGNWIEISQRASIVGSLEK